MGMPCNGELTPNQYTSLIRRASSLHYPAGRHPLRDNHRITNNKKCSKPIKPKGKPQKPGSFLSETEESWAAVSPHPSPPPPPGSSKGLNTSMATPHPRLVKNVAPLKTHNPRERPRHKSQLYVRLFRGSHLSESDDRGVCRVSCITSEGNRVVRQTATSPGCSLLPVTTNPSPCSPQSVDRFDFNVDLLSGLSTCDQVDFKPSYLSFAAVSLPSSPPVPSFPPVPSPPPVTSLQPLPSPLSACDQVDLKLSYSSSASVSLPSSPPVPSCPPLTTLQPLPSPPQAPITAPKLGVIRERPYYDCGYDTDRDSPPPHSALESVERRVSGCTMPSYPTSSTHSSSSLSVWSRYLSWLHRVTKTQR